MSPPMELGSSTTSAIDLVCRPRLGTPEHPSTAYLTLLITGDFGSGKAHLMMGAIRNLMAARPDVRIHYSVLEGNAQTALVLWNKTLEESQGITGSSTEPSKPTTDLYATIKNLFASAREQQFEDGMESALSQEIISYVNQLGSSALEVISSLIIHEKVNAAVAAEALRAISRLDDTRTYNFRLWLLERSLQHSSSRVRDAALLGLAHLDDPHAMPVIKQALVSEKCIELRNDMEQVLAQLNSQCHLF